MAGRPTLPRPPNRRWTKTAPSGSTRSPSPN